MPDMLKVISPVDGRELVERSLASDADVNRALGLAKAAQGDWRNTPIETTAAGIEADTVIPANNPR